MNLEKGQQEALLKVANIGFSKAAAALSTLIQSNINLRVPEVKMVSFECIVQAIGSPDETKLVLYLKVEGDTPGKVALFFSLDSAEFVAQTLFAGNTSVNMFEDFMAQSALKEVGNIMVSSFVTALAESAGLTLMPSTPAIAIDMVGAIIDAILVEDGILDDDVLLISTEIQGNSLVEGQLVFFPDDGSLAKLLGALKNDNSN